MSKSSVPPEVREENRPRRAADLVVDCLAAHGADRIYCVPGESYLPVLDALYEHDGIQVVTCRHEGGAGFMAVADAKLTGRPGLCFVSRGPGATNAAIAVHTAEQDGVPLLLLVGQVPRHQIGRRAFQEVDYIKTFADMAKGIWTIHDPEHLPEAMARAFAVAVSPTPGPVVVVFPEDMLEHPATETTASLVLPTARSADGSEATKRVAAHLTAAKRPLLIAGGAIDRCGKTVSAGRAALLATARMHEVPVVLSFKRQDMFPNDDPLYAGHLGFKIPAKHLALYREADLVVAVGTRLGEVTSQGYRFPLAPLPSQPLIHIHDDPSVLGRVFATEMALIANPVGFLKAMATISASGDTAHRGDWARRLHTHVAAARKWTAPDDNLLDMGAVLATLCERAADDAILITDAGNFSGWLHRHFPFNGRQRLLAAVGGGMGFAVPAAVAAGLRCPGRQVIALAGDGGFMMTGGELATAARYGVPVKIFISDNGSYGTIRMHQERQYPGRSVATDLHNPDFVRLAEAYGMRGLALERISDAREIVEIALDDPRPVVVAVRAALNHISAFTNLAPSESREEQRSSTRITGTRGRDKPPRPPPRWSGRIGAEPTDAEPGNSKHR